jgi:hypothetical protein
MYSYSSGLERLCKLAIACNEYAAAGEFPRLRSYSHKIGNLLDAVEHLSPPPSGPGVPPRKEKYCIRPWDALDPDLTNTVERFASGAGRYEHLDSLWNEDAGVNTYNEWSALAAKASVAEDVRQLILLKERMAYALQSELANSGLLWTAQRVTQDLDVPLYEASVGVALSLFRKARWAATVLDVATYYTRQELPLLGEVVSRVFIHSTADFFNHHIARMGDKEVVGEELEAAYERIHEREAEQDS